MCLREGQTRRNGARKRSVLEYMSIPSPVSTQYGRVQIHFRQSLGRQAQVDQGEGVALAIQRRTTCLSKPVM